jgi:phage FluMu protein Com
MPTNETLNPIKCTNCGKKIGEVKMRDGRLEIVCPKCGVLNIQEARPDSSGKPANNG